MGAGRAGCARHGRHGVMRAQFKPPPAILYTRHRLQESNITKAMSYKVMESWEQLPKGFAHRALRGQPMRGIVPRRLPHFPSRAISARTS